MINNADWKFHIGPLGDNRWLALSYEEPYLCFEAESKDALVGKCKKALVFCRKAQIELDRARKTHTFRATDVVSAKELEDA